MEVINKNYMHPSGDELSCELKLLKEEADAAASQKAAEEAAAAGN